jgi:hypothetical protein
MDTEKYNNGGRVYAVSVSLCLCLSLGATPAWAVQAHAGSEGLISHQIGHILFFIGMLVLLARQYRRQLKGPGWCEFKVFLWLIILWNGLTFSGHWLHEVVPMDKFIKSNSHTTGFQAIAPVDFIFYVTRLDHIVLAPAFFFLLLALKRWDQTS